MTLAKFVVIITIALTTIAVALIVGAVILMEKEQKRGSAVATPIGCTVVKEQCITDLKNIAHHLAQEMSDPMLPGYARRNYAEMIQAVNALDESRKSEEE